MCINDNEDGHDLIVYWDHFTRLLKQNIQYKNISHLLPTIKLLLTSEKLIFKNPHDFYPYAEIIYRFGQYLLNIAKAYPSDQSIQEQLIAYQTLLQNRFDNPLNIIHNKLPNAHCFFEMTNAMLNEENMDIEISLLDKDNEDELTNAINAIENTSLIGHGLTFAGLPLVGDMVIKSLITAKNTLCVLSKTQSNRIIGHCWGILLENIKSYDEHGNLYHSTVFWVCNIARHADFFDRDYKVGHEMRTFLIEYLEQVFNCDFVGFQHQVGHSFHENAINTMAYDKISNSKEDNFRGQVQGHLIRNNTCQKPFPNFKEVSSALINYTWQACPNAPSFFAGASAYFGRYFYNHFFNINPESSLLPHEENFSDKAGEKFVINMHN